MRSFEFARKIVDNKVVLDSDGKEVLAFPDAQLPEYQTSHSAGADFFCAESVTIPSIFATFLDAEKEGIDLDTIKKSVQPTLVRTGIKANMGHNEVLEIYNRSSNPKKLGLVLANSVGVIDSDYFENKDNDGEIMFAFYNFGTSAVTLNVGDRVGQGVFKEFLRPEVGLRVKEVERNGGFGSTDK